ncbi:MAG: ABC transporter substrate-binding protein [Ignavibacteriales bacterium]|nr:MAG: ABC transporter substrate-binding protein [Ignavibacteriales bacterium]
MKVKNLLFIGLVFILLMSCGGKEDNKIKIGAIVFLSGDAAEYGAWVKNGLELAKDEINRKEDINFEKIEIVYEDDKSTPKEAVTAFNKMMSEFAYPIIIAGLTSSSTLSITPLAEKNKVVLFSPCSSNPKISSAGDYIFRNWPSDNLEGEAMARFAYNALNIKKVAIVALNNDYGLGLREVFTNNFISEGGEVVYSDQINEGQREFRTIIQKLKSANIKAVYIPSHAQECAHFIRQSKELGYTPQFLSCVTFQSSELFKIAGNAAEGSLFTTPGFDINNNDSLVVDFRKKYNLKYNTEPEVFAAQSYDALKIIAYVIKNYGYSSEIIKNELYKIKNYPGVSGLTTFDSNGDVQKPVMIKKVQNGEFKVLVKSYL